MKKKDIYIYILNEGLYHLPALSNWLNIYVIVLIKKQLRQKNLINSPSRLLLEYYFFLMRWNISIVTMYRRIRVENYVPCL